MHSPVGSEPKDRMRWGAIALFVFASSFLNFLDRQLLAAVAPTLRTEYQLSNAQYGEVVAVFSLAYALGTPLFGLLIDKVGLALGTNLAVVLWSLSSVCTGVFKGFPALLTSRIVLGIGESASIPAASKASATYLPASELGFANAVGSIAVTLGTVSAPLLVATVGAAYGWRSVFVLSGVLAIPWIVAWTVVSSRVRPASRVLAAPLSLSREKLGDARLWVIAAAYALVMAQYTLWLGWTTLYFVQERHLSAAEANRYFAWIPPLFATLGAFLGASLAFYWIRRSLPAIQARLRVYGLSLPLVLCSALVPLMPTPTLAALGIGLSFLGCMSIVSAVHVLPVDLFGARHAAFSASILAASYALLQAFLSPVIGGVVDRVGFEPLCIVMPLFPVAGFFVARAGLIVRERRHVATLRVP
jgi:MFS family permease